MKKIIFTLIFLTYIGVSIRVFAEIESPKVEARGAILMEAESGRVLWERNSEEPMAMASTTKIMTAIIALERGNLDDVVTASAYAARQPEVNMDLTEGEELRLRDLLYALMLMSYNDAAVAIAEHISGDVESFCTVMTDKARELGAKSTVFGTPSGLDQGEHHSTAYDMALITRYALQNEEFVRLINVPYVTVQSNRRSIDLRNKNRLLSEYSGAIGVKTGFTGRAGQCFVGSAERDGMKLISVVLASGWGAEGREQKWIDTKRILDYGFENYSFVELAQAGQVPGHVDITRTRTPRVDVALAEGITLPMNADEKSRVEMKFEYPQEMAAPVEAGQVIGQGIISLDGAVLARIDLVTLSGAMRHDLPTSARKVLETWLEMGTNGRVDLSGFEVFR